jgi:MFS family permease
MESLSKGTDAHAIPVGSNEGASFYRLLKDNREFRLYIISYLVTKCGEWLTYVASISMIEDWLGGGHSTSRTAISYLVVIRIMPNVILSAAGGALADSRDRRHSMIALDLLGSVVTLLFLVALHYKSIAMVYVVTVLQETVAALYEPCRGALLPLLVTDEEGLKNATTLSGLAWSLMAAVGASLGGVLVALFGWKFCFCKLEQSLSLFRFQLHVMTLFNTAHSDLS